MLEEKSSKNHSIVVMVFSNKSFSSFSSSSVLNYSLFFFILLRLLLCLIEWERKQSTDFFAYRILTNIFFFNIANENKDFSMKNKKDRSRDISYQRGFLLRTKRRSPSVYECVCVCSKEKRERKTVSEKKSIIVEPVDWNSAKDLVEMNSDLECVVKV